MDLNYEATELRLALPGTDDLPDMNTTTTSSSIKSNKRTSPDLNLSQSEESRSAPPTKTQVVGWPPVRSYRKNVLQGKKAEPKTGSGMYVKVSMDGAPYLRKIDLKVYKSYEELMKGLEKMFSCIIGLYVENEGYNGSKHAATYEDKDGDWMLVGDVPFEMFVTSCKRLRIMKGNEARGSFSLNLGANALSKPLMVMGDLNLVDLIGQPYGLHKHYNVGGYPVTVAVGSGIYEEDLF